MSENKITAAFTADTEERRHCYWDESGKTALETVLGTPEVKRVLKSFTIQAEKRGLTLEVGKIEGWGGGGGYGMYTLGFTVTGEPEAVRKLVESAWMTNWVKRNYNYESDEEVVAFRRETLLDAKYQPYVQEQAKINDHARAIAFAPVTALQDALSVASKELVGFDKVLGEENDTDRLVGEKLAKIKALVDEVSQLTLVTPADYEL